MVSKACEWAGYRLDIGTVVEVGLSGITSFLKHFFWTIRYITALNVSLLSFGRQCLRWKHGKGPCSLLQAAKEGVR